MVEGAVPPVTFRSVAPKVGVLVAPSADAPATVVRAEQAGLDSAWFVDSPALFGDVFVAMAAAAVQTQRITLATGVTNPVLRTPPVLASMLASINALAPGRVILGIGTGFTATGALGLPSATNRRLSEFVQQVRGLLRGEVVDLEMGGTATRVAFINPTRPWLELERPIPVCIAASGPKTLAMAALLADAILLGGITQPEIVAECIDVVRRARRDAGLEPGGIDIAITPSVYLTDADVDLDDPADFEHLREALGPKSLAPAQNFSTIAEASSRVPAHITERLVAVRAAYRPPADDGDPTTCHLRSYKGYMTSLKDEQRPLVTKEVLAATTLAGSVDQCVAKLRRLEEAGITHVVLSPLPQHVGSVIEGFGSHVLPALRS